MPTLKTACLTPSFMLHKDGQPIGPRITSNSPAGHFVAIYGFSGKPAYDVFLSNSEGDLRPYPIMKGYLKRRIDEDAATTCLVALDAVGPDVATMEAVTMESVWSAQKNGLRQISSEFQLRFCTTTNSYEMEHVPS